MLAKTLIPAALLLLLFISWKPDNKQYKIKTKYRVHAMRIIDDSAIKSGTLYHLDTLYQETGVMVTNKYDADGNLILQISSDGSKTVSAKAGNLSVYTITDASEKIISTQTCFLNKNGKTDSSIVEQNGMATSARKFIYDALGNEIENKEYHAGDGPYGPLKGGGPYPLRLIATYKINYRDGNAISESIILPGSSDTMTMINPKTLKLDTVIQVFSATQSIVYYDYFTDKLNTTYGSTNSKNLLKRSVEITADNDTDRVDNYRYNFDSKGRVVTEVLESAPGYKDGTTKELEYDSSAYTYY